MAYRGTIMLKWDHWHIEASSICALKCPRCPRAEIPETLLNKQLSLEFFQDQIGDEIIKSIRKITFCGNDGDPIYARDFLEIVKWIKSVNQHIQLVIITNGSYKSTEWWQSLSCLLNKHDEVHWSLDGWDQVSNEIYRINCNWSSIINGIKTFRLHNKITYTVWASIAFRFNETQIKKQQHMAEILEFDMFQLTKSTKFGSKYPDSYSSNDELEPTDSSLVANNYRFERVSTALSEKKRPGIELKKVFLQRAKDLVKENKHAGICMIGNKGVFLNSHGKFYPCCWTANRYEHNAKWHELAHANFDLNKKTFKEIINDSFWTTDFLKFDSLECTTKCTKEKLKDSDHTSEW